MHVSESERRIRVGFVSRFLYYHAIGRILMELIQAFDKSKFEIFIFAITPREPDRVSAELEQTVEHYVALPEKLRLCHEEILSRDLDVLIYPEVRDGYLRQSFCSNVMG